MNVFLNSKSFENKKNASQIILDNKNYINKGNKGTDSHIENDYYTYYTDDNDYYDCDDNDYDYYDDAKKELIIKPNLKKENMKKIVNLTYHLKNEYNIDQNIKKIPQKRRPLSVQKFKPKTSPLLMSQSDIISHNKKSITNISQYKFVFNDQIKFIKLQDDRTIENEEELIKNEFHIFQREELIYYFIKNEDKKEYIDKKNLK